MTTSERTIRARLTTHPDDPEALRLLASVVAQTRSVPEAETLLRRAIAVRPRHVLAHADLTSLLCRDERSGEALAVLDDVIAAEPEKIWPLSLKAAALDSERRTKDALQVHKQLVARAAHVAVPWVNYGHALQVLGRADDAAVAFRKSIELDPANGFAWWGLANLRAARLDERDITSLERALESASSDLSRAQLHFTLGKALGDHGAFARSFRHYEHGNATRRTFAPYDAEAVTEEVRAAGELFASDNFQRPLAGCDAQDSIFIVGMPRSGSTLVEQILASHPMVEGLGELFEIRNLAGRVSASRATASWPRVIAETDGGGLHDLGGSYLASTRRYRRTDRPFFTDKMPSNWRFSGMIRLILPKAKIIDVRRDPLACCFSNYTTYFNRETRAPTTLEELGRRYRDYAEMMAQLEHASPGRIHRVQYENLIGDLEGEVRRLLDYLELPFDDACLRFHETQRAIHTPSAQQVRQPINDDGLARWRNYDPWLGPLKAALEEPLRQRT